jgi:hypothetical protein
MLLKMQVCRSALQTARQREPQSLGAGHPHRAACQLSSRRDLNAPCQCIMLTNKSNNCYEVLIRARCVSQANAERPCFSALCMRYTHLC